MRILGALLITLSALAAPGAALAGDDPIQAVATAPPWMGITMDDGSDIGVPVLHVVRGSPAEKGGVKVGDRVVTVDGARVVSAGQITRAVQARKIGEVVTLEVDRTKSSHSLRVALAPRPDAEAILRMDLVGRAGPVWTNVIPLSGAPASLDEVKGKVVVLDFWASWCAPCRMLAPKLSALKDRYGAQGLAVVGITTDEVERAAVFAERHQMRYGIVVDKAGATSRSYGISSLPTMLLIDKKGVVREVFVGYDPGQDARVEGLIRSLLAEPAR